MMIGTRDDAERLLAKALSRHIGYTSGAYDLTRIFSTLDAFRERTSAYEDELVTFLGGTSETQATDTISAKYRADILSFASSMGLIEPVSARDAKLTRFAATELGRSLLGAQAVGDAEFYSFYSAQIVLRADADFMLPVLRFLKEPNSIGLQAFFVEYQGALRNKRLDWLSKVFPERILLDRIINHLSWAKKSKSNTALYEADIPTLNTARHHATPRQGWAEQLGMANHADRSLTAFGEDVLRGLDPSGQYFWVSPPREALNILRIADAPAGQPEDEIRFTTAMSEPNDHEQNALARDLAEVMKNGYQAAKLVHAPQASLQLPIEYIFYRSYIDKRAYRWEEILELLFRTYRGDFERFSARKGKIGFYRVVGV